MTTEALLDQLEQALATDPRVGETMADVRGHVDAIRTALTGAPGRQELSEVDKLPGVELTYDVVTPLPPPVMVLTGRIGSVQEGSHELCLTQEQVETILAGGDDI